MTAGARAASYGYPNIAYQCTDFLEAPLEDASFDCVISIATLHHMPLTEALPKIRRVLIAGGMFLAMDLLQPKSWSDHICSALAFGLRRANALVSPGLQRSPQLEEAWRAHGNRESYLTISEARKIFTNALPNAQVKRHLFWRYSVIWKKPVRADHGAY